MELQTPRRQRSEVTAEIYDSCTHFRAPSGASNIIGNSTSERFATSGRRYTLSHLVS